MISKTFLLYFVLVRLLFISSEEEFFRMPKLRAIQDEIFGRMSQFTRVSWNQTAPGRQNYHMYPIQAKMRHYFLKTKLFYDFDLDQYSPQDEFLERPYALARILDKLQNTSDVELKFPNAYFYDPRYTSWHFLQDQEKHYHTETYEISFEPENEQSVAKMINNWTSIVTRGQQSGKERYRMASMNFHGSYLIFTGCWESTKTHMLSIVMNKRRKRFIPAIPVLAKLKFEVIKEQIEVQSFSGIDTIGYYKDTKRKFEAIRIPFKNEEFAMVVMLPYYNQSLEIFSHFTGADYRQLLQRVDEYYEIVDYTIPEINSSAITMNGNGVSINGGDLCNYIDVPEEKHEKKFSHRLFIVDRPFGIILYHEPTSFVFMYALVRNPLSNLWPSSKLQIRVNMYGDEEDIQPYL